jgi:hypothetical protein
MVHRVEAVREREGAECPDERDDGQAAEQAMEAEGRVGPEERPGHRRSTSVRKIPPAHDLYASSGPLRETAREYIVKRYTYPAATHFNEEDVDFDKYRSVPPTRGSWMRTRPGSSGDRTSWS